MGSMSFMRMIGVVCGVFGWILVWSMSWGIMLDLVVPGGELAFVGWLLAIGGFILTLRYVTDALLNLFYG
mgnify:CR=1 FL=1